MQDFTPMTTIMRSLKPTQSRAAREAAERRKKLVNASAVRPLDLDNRPRLELPQVVEAEPIKKYPIHAICKHPLDGAIKWVRDPKGLTPKGIKCPHCTPENERQNKAVMAEKNLTKLFADADIPNNGKEWTFDNFPAEKDQGAMEEVREAVARSIEMMKDGGTGINIYLYGLTASGKTGMACSALREYMQAGIACLHMLVSKYFRLLQQSYNKSASPELAKLEELVLSVPVLVFDDLGAEYQSKSGGEWAIKKIFTIIEERRAAGLVTIITANDSLANLRRRYQTTGNEIEKIDVQQQVSRVLRRIKESYIVVEVLGGFKAGEFDV